MSASVGRVISWNIEGLGAQTLDGIPVKVAELIHYMKANNATLMCLQETHIPENAVETKKDYTWYFSGKPELTNPKISHAGVAIVVRNKWVNKITHLYPV